MDKTKLTVTKEQNIIIVQGNIRLEYEIGKDAAYLFNRDSNCQIIEIDDLREVANCFNKLVEHFNNQK